MDQIGPRAARASPWLALVLHLLDHAWRPAAPATCPHEVRPGRCSSASPCDSIEIAHAVAEEVAARLVDIVPAPTECAVCPTPVSERRPELSIDLLGFWPWLGAVVITQIIALISWVCSRRARRPLHRPVPHRPVEVEAVPADILPSPSSSTSSALAVRGGSGPRRPSDRRQ